MKVGSLFSGIEGFGLGFERAGMTLVWEVEIDAHCRKIEEHHFPHAKRFLDVRDVGSRNLEPVDLICGGFPCQDLSIAGKRAGLAGKQSSLWFEFHRIVSELLPMWVVIENVPGLLSSNGGADIQIIIDGLTQTGYTVDVDILNAQYFGLAQRRRRVFLTCVRLDALLSKRTPLSVRTSADLVIQTLLNGWGVLPPAWSAVPLRSDFDKPNERCAVLLQKMMSLFNLTQGRLAFKKYQSGLGVLLDQFGGAVGSSEFGLTASAEQPEQLSPVMDMCEYLLKRAGVDAGPESISASLSSILADACAEPSKSTTSISSQPTTGWQIFTYAAMGLHTIGHIVRSLDWSESCWSVALSASMFLRESTSYARRASSDLFVEPGLRDGWRDYFSAASDLYDILERCAGSGSTAKIFSRSPSCVRDTPSRRAKGQGVAPTINAGANRSGGTRPPGYNAEESETLVTAPLKAQDPARRNGGSWPIADEFVVGSLIAHHGRNNPDSQTFVAGALAASRAKTAQSHSKEHGTTQQAAENNQLIAFAWQQGTSAKGGREYITRKGDYVGALGNSRHDAVVGGFGVRRLTPRECERLQGFPDDFTVGQSDSVRYRQLGNAVCVSVAEWIGRQITAQTAKTGILARR